jgi:hypothetical protein
MDERGFGTVFSADRSHGQGHKNQVPGAEGLRALAAGKRRQDSENSQYQFPHGEILLDFSEQNYNKFTNFANLLCWNTFS